MKTSIVFNLVFASSTILLCFLLIIDLYFLIPATVLQIFIPTAELEMPTIGMPTNEANVEIETQPLTAETEIKSNSKTY